MNKVVLVGRLTKDPEVRYSQGVNSTAVARYSLAVDRRFKKDGEASADFINCIAFGRSGEFAEKYLKKGTKIAVVGRIQTGSYEKDGRKVYTTDVVVEEHEFVESKQEEHKPSDVPVFKPTSPDGFMSIPDGIEEELPFN
jgi:single-strand DNA-binding protein